MNSLELKTSLMETSPRTKTKRRVKSGHVPKLSNIFRNIELEATRTRPSDACGDYPLKLISSEAGQPLATAIHDIIHTLCLPILFSSGQETLINVHLQSSDCTETYDQNHTKGIPKSYQLL